MEKAKQTSSLLRVHSSHTASRKWKHLRQHEFIPDYNLVSCETSTLDKSSSSSNSGEEDALEIVYGEIRYLSSKERKRYSPFTLVIEKSYKLSRVCGTDEKQIKWSITVPVGFLSDGASGGPDWGISWIFHDWLYATHCLDDGTQLTREMADGLMEYLLNCENHTSYQKIMGYLATHDIMSLFSNAWKNSFRTGPLFLHDFSA